MNISIIGSGNVGTALATGWAKAGHKITFGVRDPHSAKAMAAAEKVKGSHMAGLKDALKSADIIVITTPADAATEIAGLLIKDTKQVIIDATNAVRVKPEPYATAFHALKAIAGAEHVVKCFNTTGYENMADPVYGDVAIDMFMAGNSKKAKQIAENLSNDIGFGSCIDFGGDDKVELLEKMALCWINLAIMQGQGRNIAFKLHRR